MNTCGSCRPDCEDTMTCQRAATTSAADTGEAAERLKHAYQDIHGRLSSYYEEVVGAPYEQAETNAHNLMGEYAEALIQNLKEQQ